MCSNGVKWCLLPWEDFSEAIFGLYSPRSGSGGLFRGDFSGGNIQSALKIHKSKAKMEITLIMTMALLEKKLARVI